MIYIVLWAAASQGIGGAGVSLIFNDKESAMAHAKTLKKFDTVSIECWEKIIDTWHCSWNADINASADDTP